MLYTLWSIWVSSFINGGLGMVEGERLSRYWLVLMCCAVCVLAGAEIQTSRVDSNTRTMATSRLFLDPPLPVTTQSQPQTRFFTTPPSHTHYVFSRAKPTQSTHGNPEREDRAVYPRTWELHQQPRHRSKTMLAVRERSHPRVRRPDV